ncbi:MAG: phosphoenolpyruvate carboxykinase (GTP), partial [Clostridiales bacterium]|nr:phosphoenolpyruvate carboxykinase (GTP) [Clostridiales bacterium]
NVNWFRLDDEGNFIWPGYGENFRVIDWIIRRCKGEADAQDTAIGFLPAPKDIDISDLDYEISPGRKFGQGDLEGILKVETDYWKDDIASIKEFYSQFGGKLPAELSGELATLEKKLG